MSRSSTRNLLLILFGLVLLPAHSISAQQNGSFESWSPSGSPPPFDWKFPTGWTTNNATTEFITAGVTRNNYNHSGEFAAQIKTLNIFGAYTRSQLALGNCKLDYAHYQLNAYTGGEPLAGIPDNISFYYQLTTGVPSEYAVADLLIKRGSGSSLPDTIYHASMHLPAVDIYTEVQMNIPEVGINISTDSIVILFSSNDTNEIAVNILYVDDVTINSLSATNPVPESTQDVTIYPNPVRPGELLTIQWPVSKAGPFKIYDTAGNMVACCLDAVESGNRILIQTSQLLPGLYFLTHDRSISTFVVIKSR